MRNQLFVLSGPSATGKSTILSKIVEEGLCEIATKYSNRKKRRTVFDDIQDVSREYIFEFCDEVNYEMYGNLYGFNVKEIKERLKKTNLIAICSDFDSIRKMKALFNGNISAIFIYLDGIFIENLLKAYIERRGLNINDEELFLLSKELSKALKKEDKSRMENLEKIFLTKLKAHLSDIDFEEFKKRYKSFMRYGNYNVNKHLFDHTVSGETMDELLERCRDIIRRG